MLTQNNLANTNRMKKNGGPVRGGRSCPGQVGAMVAAWIPNGFGNFGARAAVALGRFCRLRFPGSHSGVSGRFKKFRCAGNCPTIMPPIAGVKFYVFPYLPGAGC